MLDNTANTQKALGRSRSLSDISAPLRHERRSGLPAVAGCRAATFWPSFAPLTKAPPGVDRGRRSDSVTPRPAIALSVRQDRDRTATATATAPQPQFLSPPQPRPGRAGTAQRRRAPASLARVARARRPLSTARRSAGERRPPASRRARRSGHHSRAGLKGAAAERVALRRKHRNPTSERSERVG